MILSDSEIRRLISASPPLVAGFLSLDEQVQPNGIDLTLRDVARFVSAGKLGAGMRRELAKASPVAFEADGFVLLGPGSYLLTFNEVVSLPADLMAVGWPRSSLLRCGATVCSAVWDAGY